MASRADVLRGAFAIALGAFGWYLGTGLEPTPWITWVAAAPLLAFCAGVRAHVAAGAALLAIALGGLNQWTYAHAVLRLPPPAIAAMVLLPAVVMAIGAAAMRSALQRGGPLLALWAVPLVWTAAEWSVARTSPHGAFWSLAYTQADLLPVVQVASLGGPWAVSFMLLLVGSALGLALHGGRSAAVRVLPLVAVLVCAQVGYGCWRLAAPAGDREIDIALLAGDHTALPPRADTAGGEALLAGYLAQLDGLPAGAAVAAVLPENIVGVEAAARARLEAALQASASAKRMTIVAGVGEVDAPAPRNLALAVDSSGARHAYAKRHLLPGLESRFVAGATDLAIGASDGTVAGVAICKDMDFPELVRRHARAGAMVMLVPAWDFDVDGRLHAQMARMRGIESGLAIARNARGGRLTLSDSRGRLSIDVPAGSAAPQLAAVAVAQAPTWYALHGDVFAWAVCAALAVLLAWCWRPGRRPRAASELLDRTRD